MGIGDSRGSVKEGEGGNVTVYREDFGKEVGWVDEAGDKYKAEKILAYPLLQPIETHVDRLGRTEEVTAHSLSTNRRGGDCWGWPRLVRVSESSANTCPPPKAAAYSASATDATTTGMRWQKA